MPENWLTENNKIRNDPFLLQAKTRLKMPELWSVLRPEIFIDEFDEFSTKYVLWIECEVNIIDLSILYNVFDDMKNWRKFSSVSVNP